MIVEITKIIDFRKL